MESLRSVNLNSFKPRSAREPCCARESTNRVLNLRRGDLLWVATREGDSGNDTAEGARRRCCS